MGSLQSREGLCVDELYLIESQIPYATMSNTEAVEAIARGHRLEQLPDCEKEIYGIMTACWMVKPDERPTFKELFDRLHKLSDHNESNNEIAAIYSKSPGDSRYANLSEIVK